MLHASGHQDLIQRKLCIIYGDIRKGSL